MRAKGKQLGGSVSLLKVRDEHCAVECIGIRWQRCAYGARLNREQVKKIVKYVWYIKTLSVRAHLRTLHVSVCRMCICVRLCCLRMQCMFVCVYVYVCVWVCVCMLCMLSARVSSSRKPCAPADSHVCADSDRPAPARKSSPHKKDTCTLCPCSWQSILIRKLHKVEQTSVFDHAKDDEIKNKAKKTQARTDEKVRRKKRTMQSK